jgi:Leucine-rich repeat (LRR) protein
MMEHVDCHEMTELRFIDLSDNRLASIHGLEHCPFVLELCLSDNRIARVGSGLTCCSGLQLLNMDSNLLINCRVSLSVMQLFVVQSI